MIVPDGTEARHGFRVRRWVMRAALIGLGLLLFGIVLFFVLYSSVLARAAMTDQLRAENERLRRYYYKVQMLEENLNQTREIVTRLTELAGIDYEFPELPDDSAFFAAMERPPVAVMPRASTADPYVPSGLPVQGFISQDFEVEDGERFHPGVDIACAVGSPVLATAAGEVVFAAFDSTYGNLVIIRHSDSLTTLYGHHDSLLVTLGQPVSVGSRIALSGNTGKSTAPHVHYEVRLHDKPINPLEEFYHEENKPY